MIILPLLAPSMAWGAEPFARSSVEDDGRIVTGQQVLVDVDIFVPDFFTSPPELPLFDIPNALVTLPDSRTQNITQTIDGVQYSGIRKAYAIVPQTSGTVTVPEVKIGVGYSLDGKPAKASVTMPSVSFNVAAPAASDQPGFVFAANNVTIEQSFDQDSRSLKVGDALVRTITVTAEDTQAMMFPPVEVGTAAGLHQYARQPRIEDGIAVGRDTESRRTETYVYTADKEGTFVIPAVLYDWFDVTNHEAKSASLPSVQVTISAALSRTAIKPVLDEVPREPPYVVRQRIAGLILVLLVAGAIAWLAYRLLPRLTGRLDEARERRRASYGYRLGLLRKVLHSGKEAEIYRALHDWSRSLGYRTLDDWVGAGPDELKHQVEILSRRLFQSGAEAIDRARISANVDCRRKTSATAASALPPLNP